MKTLIIFKSGRRHVGDTLALVLPEHPSNIARYISLEKATDKELEQLKQDPHNDILIKSVQER